MGRLFLSVSLSETLEFHLHTAMGLNTYVLCNRGTFVEELC